MRPSFPAEPGVQSLPAMPYKEQQRHLDSARSYNHGQITLGHLLLSQSRTHFWTLGASPLPPNQCWA